MLEIRFHGRGGQGTVLAAKILAEAVLRGGGGECLAIPEFGVERRGAPVVAYARISDGRILVRSRIYAPDAVVLMDPGVISDAESVRGIKPAGTLIVNTGRSIAAAEARWPGLRVIPVPARRIATAHLGPAASPIVNTAMCGAVVAVFALCDLKTLEDAVRACVPLKPEGNAAAAREAYILCRGAVHAAA